MDKQASSGEQCIVCGKSANASVKRELTKDFHLCDSCYKTAYELDMTVARKLKFEPADHVIDNIFLGSEGSTIREDWYVSASNNVSRQPVTHHRLFLR